MKKLALALVCMFSVAFFASCTKTIENPEPSITPKTGDYFITGTSNNPTVIDANDVNYVNYQYGFHVEANSETKKELKNLVIILDVNYYVDGEENEVYYDTIDLTGKTSDDYIEYLFEPERAIYTLMDGSIKAVVTDVDGQSSSETVYFTVEMEESPLFSYTVEWTRKGANLQGTTEEEMAALGLKWSGSYKEVFATIEPLNDDVTLYLCNGNDFEGIEFWSDKYTYFSNLIETAEPILKYRNITTNNDSSYNDMLAVINGDELNLIHITYADIETGSYGTQITITAAVK